MLAIRVILAAALLTLGAGAVHSEANWLRWGGPGQDFHAPAGDIATSWPEALVTKVVSSLSRDPQHNSSPIDEVAVVYQFSLVVPPSSGLAARRCDSAKLKLQRHDGP